MMIGNGKFLGKIIICFLNAAHLTKSVEKKVFFYKKTHRG